MSDYAPSNWQERANAGDWLGAAKLAVTDQGAATNTALTCATIALAEAILHAAHDDLREAASDALSWIENYPLNFDQTAEWSGVAEALRSAMRDGEAEFAKAREFAKLVARERP